MNLVGSAVGAEVGVSVGVPVGVAVGASVSTTHSNILPSILEKPGKHTHTYATTLLPAGMAGTMHLVVSLSHLWLSEAHG